MVSVSAKNSKRKNARLIAFYLPQFHPIPENDTWWGKGFTEWTNVAKAKPMFRGHSQPHVPADLGFYDLRVPEVRAAQAEMASEHGIEGFCYWHYWFAGKQLLEQPFAAVLKSGEPNFPFCLAWANDSWSGIWHGAPGRLLIEQTYPGFDDHEKHFNALLPAFGDNRYIKVSGKPLLVVYKPKNLPDSKRVTDFWRELAIRAGLKGLHLVGVLQSELDWNPTAHGFDGAVISNQTLVSGQSFKGHLQQWGRDLFPGRDPLFSFYAKILRRPLHVYEYKKAMIHFLDARLEQPEYYPTLVPNWDNTPRSGYRGVVLKEATPELFRLHIRQTLETMRNKKCGERLVFIKSWNEWAEGNYLEPDIMYGDRHLRALRDEVCVF